MATASELRGIIRTRPVQEAVPMAVQMAVGMFDKQQNEADKAVGKEMAKIAKRYISVLQGITGLKDGWVVSPTSHLLSIDNEEGGITIDIHWESDLGTGKVDVTVELNKRSGPERPGAKWKSKFHIVKGLTPDKMNLSPTKILTDAAVRRFLKEHAEELLAPLMEEDGWQEAVLTEAIGFAKVMRGGSLDDMLKSIVAAYDKGLIDNRGYAVAVGLSRAVERGDAKVGRAFRQMKPAELAKALEAAAKKLRTINQAELYFRGQAMPVSESKMDPFAQKVRREFTGLMRSLPKVLQRASAGGIPWKVIAKEDLYGNEGLYMSIYCGEDARVSMQKGAVTSPSGDPFVVVEQWDQGQDEFRVRVGLDYEESGTTEFIDETAVDSSKAIGILKRAPMEFTRWLKKHNFTFKIPEGVEMDTVQELRALIERKPHAGGRMRKSPPSMYDTKEVKGKRQGKKVPGGGARGWERRSAKKEIEAQMRGEDIENALAIIEDGDIIVMDHFLDALLERRGTFIDLTTVPTERDAMRLRKWVKETGKEAGRMMSNSMDPVYVLDPSMLLKDKTLGGLFKLAARDYLGRDVEMEKVRSPKTGKPGWRMSFAAGGENVALGADARTAQLAFNKLKAALRKTKLPTSTGQMRKAEAGEFMLMNMADGNRKAMFKHSDTRNYVIVDMKSGKLDVPVTLKPFFRGQFDVYEEVEQPAPVVKESAAARLRGIIERKQRQHPKKDPELAKRVWSAIKGEGKTSAPGVLKVTLPSKVAAKAGVGSKASEVDLMRVPAQMLGRIAMAVGVTEGLEESNEPTFDDVIEVDGKLYVVREKRPYKREKWDPRPLTVDAATGMPAYTHWLGLQKMRGKKVPEYSRISSKLVGAWLGRGGKIAISTGRRGQRLSTRWKPARGIAVEGLEEAGNRKRLERAIYKAAGPSNRMVMRDVDGRKVKSTLAKGGQQYVMLTGDMARALGQASYTNVALADLSDDDLRNLGSALGVAEDHELGQVKAESNDIARLRSIIQEGKPRGPVKGGGRGYWSSKEKKGKEEFARKERYSKRKEIAQQMKGEDVSLDDLGLFFELLADDYAVLDVDAIDEAMAAPMSGQMEALAKVQDTAEQLGRFATEFAGLLKRSMKKGQVDVRKMGEFGRRVDAAHSILQRNYRALASGFRESTEDVLDEARHTFDIYDKAKGGEVEVAVEVAKDGTVKSGGRVVGVVKKSPGGRGRWFGENAKGETISERNTKKSVLRDMAAYSVGVRLLGMPKLHEDGAPEWEVNLLEVDLTEFRVPTPADVGRKWLADAVDALVKGIDRKLIYGGSGATVRPYGEGYMISAHGPDWVLTIEPWKGKTSTSPEMKFWMGFDWNSRNPDIRDVKVGGKPGELAKTFAKKVNTFVKAHA